MKGEERRMIKKNPKKNLITSWIIIGAGTILVLIGAMITEAREYKVAFPVWAGLFVIIAGVAFHLLTVRCPYCGHSLAGYRPTPEVCPECHKTFED